MSKFCTNCGRPLEEGQICECQKQAQNKSSVADHLAINPKGMGAVRDYIDNMLGIHESDLNDNTDCYERGKKIVPEVIASCEDEIPIRQYHIANFRSRLKFLWAEGKLQVTNKRVVFRASGRSILGRTTVQSEYEIDQIAGLDVSQGVRFSWLEFLLALIFLFPICASVAGGVILGLARSSETLGAIFGLVAGVVLMLPFFLLRKNMFGKGVMCSMAFGVFLATTVAGLGGFGVFLAVLAIVLTIISFVIFALKPSIAIEVLCKTGNGAAVGIYSHQSFHLSFAKEVLPTSETAIAIKEVGAMIDDLKKLGDYGIEKWKVD